MGKRSLKLSVSKGAKSKGKAGPAGTRMYPDRLVIFQTPADDPGKSDRWGIASFEMRCGRLAVGMGRAVLLR
jgi:hypothetical protein